VADIDQRAQLIVASAQRCHARVGGRAGSCEDRVRRIEVRLQLGVAVLGVLIFRLKKSVPL
jgi:hypothetical protein